MSNLLVCSAIAVLQTPALGRIRTDLLTLRSKPEQDRAGRNGDAGDNAQSSQPFSEKQPADQSCEYNTRFPQRCNRASWSEAKAATMTP